jgi:MinD superfamily P-loop ATPase
VTEPTVSGLHDLKRIYQLVKKFNIRAGCMINKSDLNLQVTSEIKHFLEEEKINHISNLPYDETFTKAMVNGETIIEYNNSNLTPILIESWEKIKKIILNN